MFSIYNFSALVCVVIVVINLIAFKRRLIDFSYCIFWLVMAIAVFILSFNVNVFENMATFMSIDYAPSLLFAFGLIFVFSFIFYMTILITKLRKKIVKLTQEVGILKNKTEDQE